MQRHSVQPPLPRRGMALWQAFAATWQECMLFSDGWWDKFIFVEDLIRSYLCPFGSFWTFGIVFFRSMAQGPWYIPSPSSLNMKSPVHLSHLRKCNSNHRVIWRSDPGLCCSSRILGEAVDSLDVARVMMNSWINQPPLLFVRKLRKLLKCWRMVHNFEQCLFLAAAGGLALCFAVRCYSFVKQLQFRGKSNYIDEASKMK